MRIYMSPYSLDPHALFKSLADETRLRAALLITQAGELCVCELVYALELSQPKISRHLAQLRASGLLQDRRQGQWVYYRLNPQLAPWVHEVLQATLIANQTWLEADFTRLQCMGERPNRTSSCG